MAPKIYDAIVIGTGAGGGCVAHQLAQAGLRVLALEKGPWRSLEDFFEGGIFGHRFSSRGRGDELRYINSEYLMPERRKERRYLSYADPGAVQPTARPTSSGWMSQLVGGGTVHYGGASFRMETVDFRMQSTFGGVVGALESNLPPDLRADLRDWPVDPNEFAGWYDLAERLVGIAAGPASGLPPIRFNKAGRIIDKALRASRHQAQLIPAPLAINSGRHMDRLPCHHSGLCQDYACRFEAKSDMRVTLLRKALETGNLTIQPRTFVRKIHRHGTRATGVECLVGSPDGNHEMRTLSAGVLVIACEAVETCRLLIASGLGNPDVTGRYLMFHMTGGARSLAREPTTTWDTAPHSAYVKSYYHDHTTEDDPFLKTGILLVSSSGGPLGALKYSKWWGESALLYFNRVYPYKMDLSYIGECLPTYHNHVKLRTDQVDRYGMPGTEITYQPHPFDQNAGEYIKRKAVSILKTAGGTTEDEAPEELERFLRKGTTAKRLFHGSGGCRMGEDPNTSVVDPECCVHGFENLYIADASVFPTGSGVNPTLTIQANALRVGALIARRHSSVG